MKWRRYLMSKPHGENPDIREDFDINKMTPQEKIDYIKSFTSCRDAKTGRFLKGHSGNKNGRPRTRTTIDDCFSAVLSEKTTVVINGKQSKVTLLEACCRKIIMTALTDEDTKLLISIMKNFMSKVDIEKELPPPKIKSNKRDPYYDESVEMIKRAIYDRLDAERDGTY